MLPGSSDEQQVKHMWTFNIVNNTPCVVYTYDTHADIWKFKESGPEKLWTKCFTMSFETAPTGLKSPICTFPSGYCTDGDVMMSFHGNLVLYNSKKHKFVDVLDFFVTDRRVYSYVESLISP